MNQGSKEKVKVSNSDPRAGYWQTTEERRGEAVSPWSVPEDLEKVKSSGFKLDRKKFLKILGAGFAMAAAACRRPTEKIVPAVKRPVEMLPGVPLYYSSVTPTGTGIVIKSREGRPIKIAGNPAHPLTGGGVTATEVASTFDLYDPDRLRQAVRFETRDGKRKQQQVDAAEIIEETAEKLSEGSYVLLTGAIDSPSSRKLVDDFMKRYPGGEHHQLRPDPTLRQIKDGQKKSYGSAVIPNYRIDQAQLILSIDSDFLGTAIQPAYYSSAFGKNRDLIGKKSKTMNELIVFESMFTVTGSVADQRYSIRSGDQYLVALSLAHEIAVKRGAAQIGGHSQIASALAPYATANVARKLGHQSGTFSSDNYGKIISSVASRLIANQGKSLVIAGSPLAADGNNTRLQVAVNLLNSLLKNDGKTVDYSNSLNLSEGSSDQSLIALFNKINSGKVKTVIIADANPVYHLPFISGIGESLQKAGYVVAIADRLDETSKLANAVLPLSHFLESWGDTEMVKGIYSIRQPAVRPLFASSSMEDYLIKIAGGRLSGSASMHEFVKANWRKYHSSYGRGGSFSRFWTAVLQAGYLETPKKGSSSPRSFNVSALSVVPKNINSSPLSLDGKNLKLGLYYNPQVLDGSLANNSYRQELPEPVTKIVWNNYVSILPDTARALGVKQGSIVEVKQGTHTLKLPVNLQPGLHPGAALIALGYGRTDVGELGNNVGENALKLIGSINSRQGDDSFAFSGVGIQLADTHESYELPSTQRVYRNGFNQEDRAPFAPEGIPAAPYDASSHDAGTGDYVRPVVREATLKEIRSAKFESNPDAVLSPPSVPYPKNSAIMTSWEHTGLRWHMVVDLSNCTGCGSCVTSCMTENNIPPVGPEEVERGREMHWLRIDRYYKGPEDNPEVIHQLMMCQHCENAPCENVCPVGATNHNSEGLNVMTYNRCIGTRYCSNNCPYKVRRFNWFENWDVAEGLRKAVDFKTSLLHFGGKKMSGIRSPQQLGLNPDVTVRTRGVIEKCTFCIQRIADARREMKARNKKRLNDGAVQTACQEVCPTRAIRFGDINDKRSEVYTIVNNKNRKDKRGFRVLDFLAVKPSITYLAKIRNKG